MKKEIQVQVDSSEVLNRVSRMFDGTPKSVLWELMQNARWAGATQIDISFLDETLTIAHDGLALDDFGKLFALGSSGWDSKGIKNEDPAGMGFFVSILFEFVEGLSRKVNFSYYVFECLLVLYQFAFYHRPIQQKEERDLIVSLSFEHSRNA